MLGRLRNHLPLIMLLLTALLLSYNFTARFDLPLHDEALYARGLYKDNGGWGPLYQLTYFLLNQVTNSRILSFHILFFVLTFILLPLFGYGFARKLGYGPLSSSSLALYMLFSNWNYPVQPKIQIFNFVIFILAFLIRWSEVLREKTRLYLFYSIMILLVFCRQDNSIILAGFLLWDLFKLLRKKEIKPLISLLLVNGLAALAFWLIFGNPFGTERSWFAFRDHFLWRNNDFFAADLASGISFETSIERFFNGATSIREALFNNPLPVLTHFLKNLLQLPLTLMGNFVPVVHDEFVFFWTLIFYGFLIIMIYWDKTPSHPIHPEIKTDFKIVFSLICLKCLITATLLQPWSKYVFEINFFLFVLLLNFLARFQSAHKALAHLLPLSFPLLLLLHPFKRDLFKNEISISHATQTYQKLIKHHPIQFTMANFGVLEWMGESNYFNLYVDTKHDEDLKLGMEHFLKKSGLQLVILDPDYRRLIKNRGFEAQFHDFELRPEAFNFQRVEGVPLEGLSMYLKTAP